MKSGYILGSHVLDVEHVDLHSGQMMEQGPVLLITFQTQQIMVVHDKAGKVVEGDAVSIISIMNSHYYPTALLLGYAQKIFCNIVALQLAELFARIL